LDKSSSAVGENSWIVLQARTGDLVIGLETDSNQTFLRKIGGEE